MKKLFASLLALFLCFNSVYAELKIIESPRECLEFERIVGYEVYAFYDYYFETVFLCGRDVSQEVEEHIVAHEIGHYIHHTKFTSKQKMIWKKLWSALIEIGYDFQGSYPNYIK